MVTIEKAAKYFADSLSLEDLKEYKNLMKEIDKKFSHVDDSYVLTTDQKLKAINLALKMK